MRSERDLLKTLIAVRREIHRYPELGNEEVRTTALIDRTLKKAGIPTKRITRTGLIAEVRGERPASRAKRVFAIRADIDALPVLEKTGKPYASRRPGIMHACGHDANTTMALGAALVLSREREGFAGTVKFIFQPNEESSGGARQMIAAGVLRSPKVDAIVGMHVSPWLPAGTLGLKEGAMMASVDRFSIEITGSGGHGAYPHLGTDAVVCAAQIVTALQTLVSREIDPVDPAVVTIGTISGGERYNILCKKVTMVGTVRTLDEALHARIREMIETKLKGITSAFGASYRLVYEHLGNTLRNSGDILALCRESGLRVLGERNVRRIEKPTMGGEDFAEYLQRVPGCFLYMGARARAGAPYPWHHEKFDIDESVLPKGAMLLADTAKNFLSKET